jgi:hypothetical protein
VVPIVKEKGMAAHAREHRRMAGVEVEPWNELREDSLHEALRAEKGVPRKLTYFYLIVHYAPKHSIRASYA